MSKVSVLFFTLLFAFNLFAQRTISGRVVNEATGEIVAGCSIFINNTSKGTISDSKGHFELNDVPVGKHVLIISSIGYETNVFSFSTEQLPLQLKIELGIKVKEMEGITIEPSVEETWEKWGKTFLDNFIGTTENSSRCRIKNNDAIKFRYYKKSNRLIAYADESLKIENKALGYEISYQLENFEMNFQKRTCFFLGYSYYKELRQARKALEVRRSKAYSGSMMHFVRSIYENNLQQEGFQVRRMVKVQDQQNNGNSKEIFGKELLTADSLIIKEDGPYKILFFTDYLFITYTKEIEEDGYVRSQIGNRKPSYERSFLFLLDVNPILIEANGNYYDPKDLLSTGYWGWSEKIANTLPLDYKPEK